MRTHDMFLGWHQPSSYTVLAWVRETRGALTLNQGQDDVFGGVTNKASRHGLQIGRKFLPSGLHLKITSPYKPNHRDQASEVIQNAPYSNRYVIIRPQRADRAYPIGKDAAQCSRIQHANLA